MRVLVTGGAGFVGRQLVRTLSDRADVLIADMLRYGKPDWLDQYAFRRVDIRDFAATRSLIDEYQPDAVVHLAAIHYIPECDADPANAVATNVTGTVNLLAALAPGTRFVFASSGAVYRPDDAPHRELESVVEPSDIYGITKLQGEVYAQKLAAERQLSVRIVRLFNVIGPGETNPHLFPALIGQLQDGHQDVPKINVGNTWPKRDYIDVLDAAGGFAAVAVGEGPEAGQSEIVNLGTGHPYSVDDILSRLRSVSGVDFEVVRDARRARAVDRPFLCADISRIHELYGWSPAYELEPTLKRTWADPDFAAPDLSTRLT